MVQSEIACPKCRHQMQEGFPLDRAPTPARVGEWVEGAPEYGWLGLKSLYRCPSCGYLEAYARAK